MQVISGDILRGEEMCLTRREVWFLRIFDMANINEMQRKHLIISAG